MRSYSIFYLLLVFSGVSCLLHNSIVAVPVKNEPIALATVPGTSLLLVAHHRPVGSATADNVAACLSVIDIEQHVVVKEIFLPNGSTGIQDMSLSPDGKYAYIPPDCGHSCRDA